MGKSFKRNKAWDDEYVENEHIHQRKKANHDQRRLRKNDDYFDELIQDKQPLQQQKRK